MKLVVILIGIFAAGMLVQEEIEGFNRKELPPRKTLERKRCECATKFILAKITPIDLVKRKGNQATNYKGKREREETSSWRMSLSVR